MCLHNNHLNMVIVYQSLQERGVSTGDCVHFSVGHFCVTEHGMFVCICVHMQPLSSLPSCPLSWTSFGLWRATGPASAPSYQHPQPPHTGSHQMGSSANGSSSAQSLVTIWQTKIRGRGLLCSNKVGRPVFKLRIRTSDGVSGHSLKATHQCHLELST